jgi:hypothetical protein
VRVGEYADGRAVNFDETTQQFDVAGVVVTREQLASSDRAGRILWASADMGRWFAQLQGPTAASQSVARLPGCHRLEFFKRQSLAGKIAIIVLLLLAVYFFVWVLNGTVGQAVVPPVVGVWELSDQSGMAGSMIINGDGFLPYFAGGNYVLYNSKNLNYPFEIGHYSLSGDVIEFEPKTTDKSFRYRFDRNGDELSLQYIYDGTVSHWKVYGSGSQ